MGKDTQEGKGGGQNFFFPFRLGGKGGSEEKGVGKKVWKITFSLLSLLLSSFLLVLMTDPERVWVFGYTYYREREIVLPQLLPDTKTVYSKTK